MDKISKEFKFSFSKSSGAGGQNVNKTNTKVTLYWDLNQTKILNFLELERFLFKYQGLISKEGIFSITSQIHRSQLDNKKDCLSKLFRMIKLVQISPKKRKATKPTKSSIKKRLKEKKAHSEKKQNRSKIY